MTETDKIIDSVITLRASLGLDTQALSIADKRLVRAHVEHCILDLQRLLAQLLVAPDVALDAEATIRVD